MRRLGEVADRHRDVAEPEAEACRLDQELGVEDEVVGVALEGNLQHAAVDAEAAVEVAQVLAEGQFSTMVRTRLATYFQSGIPPASAPPRARMRVPSTTSQMPSSMKPTACGMTRLSYW